MPFKTGSFKGGNINQPRFIALRSDFIRNTMKKKPQSTDEKKYLKKLGKRLKHFREKSGYTSYEYFAYENNVSRSQYGSYETGGNIQFDTLIKILKALKVSFKDFFSEGID